MITLKILWIDSDLITKENLLLTRFERMLDQHNPEDFKTIEARKLVGPLYKQLLCLLLRVVVMNRGNVSQPFITGAVRTLFFLSMKTKEEIKVFADPTLIRFFF